MRFLADPPRTGRAACAELAEVFHHPMLEEPPTTGASAAVRRSYGLLREQAGRTCQACPLLAPCLYDAVVRHDVAGYVGGTTARERAKIRIALGVRVARENLDTLAGVTGGNRPVDHTEVVRLRAAYPDESLERLAQRLGCSLSTVKRHLRQERSTEPASGTPTEALPSMAAVVAAARTVLDAARDGGRRAA
jgi:hypothetical protein